MNEVFQKIDENEGYFGFEGFSGALNDGIWLRLVIEDIIIEMDYSPKELTARNVAMGALTQGNVPGKFSTDDLLEACDCYLQHYNDVFTDVGYVPYDFSGQEESGENGLVKAVWTKSNLFKAHAAELDAFVKEVFRDDVVNPTRN